MSESKAPGKKIRRLSDIVREARIVAAERQDAVANVRDAERARLELLSEELEPVFKELPEGDDQFDYFLSSGEKPRLWIDAIAHVHMGNDLRSYRFVRDTRHGRVVIAEGADMVTIADTVTPAMSRSGSSSASVSWTPIRPVSVARSRRRAVASAETEKGTAEVANDGPGKSSEPPRPADRQFGLVAALLWFVFGMVVMGVVLVSVLWKQIAPRDRHALTAHEDILHLASVHGFCFRHTEKQGV